jgi:hypothetical protein
VELLHRGPVTVEQFQHGAEGRDLGQFRLSFDQRRHALQAKHHLRIHRMLDPERAVLVKGRDAFLGRDKIRAASFGGGFDKVYDGLLGRALRPRGERILGVSDCRGKSKCGRRKTNECYPGILLHSLSYFL